MHLVSDPREPLWRMAGCGVAGFWVMTLLAGSFDVGRFVGLNALDIRVVVLPALVALVTLWSAVRPTPGRLPTRVATPVLITIWAGWTGLSTLWAPEFAQRASVVLDVLALVVTVWSAWVLVTVGGARMAWAFWGWLLAASLVYLAAALWAGPGAQGRFALPGGGPNVFVRVMVLGALGAVLWALRGGRFLVWWLAVPALGLGALLSGSRGGLVAGAVAVAVLAVPVVRRGRGRILALGVPGAAVAAVVALLVSGRAEAFQTLLVDRYLKQTLEQGYSSGRSDIWADAATMFWNHPVVGVGASGYEYLQTTWVHYAYPHNLFLTVASEGGLVGLVLLGVALFTVAPAVVRAWVQDDDIVWVTLAGFVFVLVASMFSGYYYDTRLLWVLAVIVVQVSVDHDASRRTEVRRPSPAARSAVGG